MPKHKALILMQAWIECVGMAEFLFRRHVPTITKGMEDSKARKRRPSGSHGGRIRAEGPEWPISPGLSL
jgi:hypothetical protein